MEDASRKVQFENFKTSVFNIPLTFDPVAAFT